MLSRGLKPQSEMHLLREAGKPSKVAILAILRGLVATATVLVRANRVGIGKHAGAGRILKRPERSRVPFGLVWVAGTAALAGCVVRRDAFALRLPIGAIATIPQALLWSLEALQFGASRAF